MVSQVDFFRNLKPPNPMILYARLFRFTHFTGKSSGLWPGFFTTRGTFMEINIGPFFRSLIIAFVFFFGGRFLMNLLGDYGYLVIIIGLIVFYAVWWRSYQQNKNK
jgi:hypothetical protein